MAPDGLASVSGTLDALPDRASVAVVTLLGTLCPITRGHMQAFVEARRLLLGDGCDSTPCAVKRPSQLERFDEVVGLVSLNGQDYVKRKLEKKGQPTLSLAQRQHLVDLAIAGIPWMACEPREGASLAQLAKRWPGLSFVHFCMNGADDVLRHCKWRWSGPECRLLTMGRPGDTQRVIEGARRAGVDLDGGSFVMGPELPDISSSEARRALVDGDAATVGRMLHPDVAAWCSQHGPWRPSAAVPAPRSPSTRLLEPP